MPIVKEVTELNHRNLTWPGYSQDELTKIQLFEDGLAACAPALFHMADQVIDDYSKQRWNVLIGDDTSGRLPTNFVRHTLRESGIYIPATYVCGSLALRKSLPPETYTNYVQNIAERLPDPMEPLIVSESAGTGQTLRFLQQLFSSDKVSADVAVLGASKSSLFSPLSGKAYTGDIGESILQDTFRTFEAVQPAKSSSVARIIAKKLMPRPVRRWLRAIVGPIKSSTHPFTGVELPATSDTLPETPVAAPASDVRYKRITHYAHTRMITLAREYHANRHNSS